MEIKNTNKTSSLIVVVMICIPILLLVVYLGTSVGKGTYSASNIVINHSHEITIRGHEYSCGDAYILKVENETNQYLCCGEKHLYARSTTNSDGTFYACLDENYEGGEFSVSDDYDPNALMGSQLGDYSLAHCIKPNVTSASDCVTKSGARGDFISDLGICLVECGRVAGTRPTYIPSSASDSEFTCCGCLYDAKILKDDSVNGVCPQGQERCSTLDCKSDPVEMQCCECDGDEKVMVGRSENGGCPLGSSECSLLACGTETQCCACRGNMKDTRGVTTNGQCDDGLVQCGQLNCNVEYECCECSGSSVSIVGYSNLGVCQRGEMCAAVEGTCASATSGSSAASGSSTTSGSSASSGSNTTSGSSASSGSSTTSGSSATSGSDVIAPSVQCKFNYDAFFSDIGIMYIKKNDEDCSCDDISDAGEWDEYGLYIDGDSNFMRCINNFTKNKIAHGYRYSLGNLKACYTDVGFERTSDGKSCVWCESGYEVNNAECIKTSSGGSSSTTKKPQNNDVDDNPQTSTIGMIIVWVIGILAVGYAFYYYRQTNEQ